MDPTCIRYRRFTACWLIRSSPAGDLFVGARQVSLAIAVTCPSIELLCCPSMLRFAVTRAAAARVVGVGGRGSGTPLPPEALGEMGMFRQRLCAPSLRAGRFPASQRTISPGGRTYTYVL